MSDRRYRGGGDARSTAEAAFRKVTAPAPPVEAEPKKAAPIPGAREMVTLRIERDVLEKFQAEGPGWQDRMNVALRKAAGL